MWHEGNLKILTPQSFQIVPIAALKGNCLSCWKLYKKINTTVMSEKYEATASRWLELDCKQVPWLCPKNLHVIFHLFHLYANKYKDCGFMGSYMLELFLAEQQPNATTWSHQRTATAALSDTVDLSCVI